MSGASFEEWFTSFRAQHRGWEADQQKSWLKAAWDAAGEGRHVMNSDREVDIDRDVAWSVTAPGELTIRDAIDLASDQDTATWLVSGGKRIARITPASEIPAAVTVWANDARISASEFMALSRSKRRAILDQFCTTEDQETAT